MEAVCAFETSVNFNVITWRYIPQESELNFCLQAHQQSVCRDGFCSMKLCIWKETGTADRNIHSLSVYCQTAE
jgi:hypothetical protein